MRHLQIAEAILKQHEGKRLRLYQCTAGKWTAGYGRNMEDKGLSKDEAEYLLRNDIHDAERDLWNFQYWLELNDTQKAALIDLRFCVGPGGYRKFVKMNKALAVKDYDEAARQIQDSLFAQQTGGRADDLARMLTASGDDE